MSLSTADLLDIRNIIKEELKSVRGDIEALSNDIKETYKMISKLQHTAITNTKFSKLTIEKKLLTLNAELLAAARQVGVTLPR